jgi:hypothetical protein
VFDYVDIIVLQSYSGSVLNVGRYISLSLGSIDKSLFICSIVLSINSLSFVGSKSNSYLVFNLYIPLSLGLYVSLSSWSCVCWLITSST